MKNIIRGLVCGMALFSGLFCGQIDAMQPIRVAVNEISDELHYIMCNDDVRGFQGYVMSVNNPNFDQLILLSCEYGSAEIFKYCLLNGAKDNLLNLRQGGDTTALMLALRGGNTEIIHILTDNMGAQIDLSVMNDDNINLLYHAYVSSNEDIISWLEDSYGADFAGNSGGLFAVACRNNKSDVAMRLITDYRDHIDPKVLFMKKSAIMYAIENSNLTLLHMIFNRRGLGIDINSPIKNAPYPARSPLLHAIYWQYTETLRHLYDRDEDLLSRIYEVIAYLLKNGADVFTIVATDEQKMPIIWLIVDLNIDHYGDYDSPNWMDRVFELAIRYNYIDQTPKCDVNTILPNGQALTHGICGLHQLKVLLQVPGININLPDSQDESLRDKLLEKAEFMEHLLKSSRYQRSEYQHEDMEEEKSRDQRHIEELREMIHTIDEFKATHPQANNQ